MQRLQHVLRLAHAVARRRRAFVVALSNNAWDMRNVAYRHPWIYRPAFIRAGAGSRGSPC
jgi:hypothetical protein